MNRSVHPNPRAVWLAVIALLSAAFLCACPKSDFELKSVTPADQSKEVPLNVVILATFTGKEFASDEDLTNNVSLVQVSEDKNAAAPKKTENNQNHPGANPAAPAADPNAAAAQPAERETPLAAVMKVLKLNEAGASGGAVFNTYVYLLPTPAPEDKSPLPKGAKLRLKIGIIKSESGNSSYAGGVFEFSTATQGMTFGGSNQSEVAAELEPAALKTVPILDTDIYLLAIFDQPLNPAALVKYSTLDFLCKNKSETIRAMKYYNDPQKRDELLIQYQNRRRLLEADINKLLDKGCKGANLPGSCTAQEQSEYQNKLQEQNDLKAKGCDLDKSKKGNDCNDADYHQYVELAARIEALAAKQCQQPATGSCRAEDQVELDNKQQEHKTKIAAIQALENNDLPTGTCEETGGASTRDEGGAAQWSALQFELLQPNSQSKYLLAKYQTFGLKPTKRLGEGGTYEVHLANEESDVADSFTFTTINNQRLPDGSMTVKEWNESLSKYGVSFRIGKTAGQNKKSSAEPL